MGHVDYSLGKSLPGCNTQLVEQQGEHHGDKRGQHDIAEAQDERVSESPPETGSLNRFSIIVKSHKTALPNKAKVLKADSEPIKNREIGEYKEIDQGRKHQ